MPRLIAVTFASKFGYGIALAVRLREDSVEQRGLSGTEIAGDHRDGSLSRLHGIVLC